MSVSIFGAILLAVSGGCFWAKSRAAAKLQDIQEARSATVGELAGLADAVAEEMGRGSWSEYVKVWGKVGDHPALTSPLTKRPCVWFRVRVTREYEYEEERTDSDGHRHCETKRGSETVSSREETVPFRLDDKTGHCTVEPGGADVELLCSLDQFERESGCYGYHFDTHGHHGHHEHKTLGYKYHEEILPVGRQVLVVGQACDGQDGLRIKRPSRKEDSLIISLKDEADLKQATAGNATMLGYGGYACAAVGVIMLVGGLFTGRTYHAPTKRYRHSVAPVPVVATVATPAHLL
jgi:hypothetical protein